MDVEFQKDPEKNGELEIDLEREISAGDAPVARERPFI
jgi:hypothetical protein